MKVVRSLHARDIARVLQSSSSTTWPAEVVSTDESGITLLPDLTNICQFRRVLYTVDRFRTMETSQFPVVSVSEQPFVAELMD